MTSPGRPIVWVLAWIAVVAVASSTVWLVIDRTGSNLLSGATASVRASSAPTTTAVSPRSPTSAGPATSAGSSGGTSTATSSGTSTGTSTGAGPTSGGTTSARPPASVIRSLTVPGGSVGMSCVDGRPHLEWATPLDGWSMEVDDEGFEVKFTQGNDGDESEVYGSCASGAPTLTTG